MGVSNKKLYCVGVGPGDPKLITIKGKEIIEQSEVIFAPIKSYHSESFALETISKVVDISGKEVIKLLFPMTTKEDKLKPYWEKAYDIIKGKVLDERRSVFVVEGDPLIYSTFNSILKIINERKEFDIEIIPGISSFQLMGAKIKDVITDGDEILVVMPASIKERSGCRTAELRSEFEQIMKIASTTFIMKSGRVINDIITRLNGDKKYKAFFGELVGTENEFISELNPEIARRENQYFSIVMIRRPREKENNEERESQYQTKGSQ